MTDTTEIAALRRRSNNLRTPDQTDAFIDLLLDKLEAERHKGDLWFGKVADLEAALKAERQRLELVREQRDNELRTNSQLEEELAALKGEQVPEAITDDMAMAFHAATTDSALGRDDMEEIKAGLRAVQELFTAAQKPVMLPKSHYVCGCADRFMSAPEVIAAIEAAGGKVAE